ncbi:MAG: TlpA family protein disulfide reductase [Chitinophagaceae bacterium]
MDTEVKKINLTDLDNAPMRLEQYQGKIIFLNFWATWCKPCKEEMPSIARAQDRLKNENIIFILASPENVDEIEAFKKNNPYKFQYARVENSEALNIQALPTTFIYNTNGVLVFSEMGFRKWDEESNLNIIQKAAGNNE